MIDPADLEETTEFNPQFDANGLIPCITTCAQTGTVLMFAFMNMEALEKTIETREAHYYSRSRKQLWHKGATSGAIQKVTSIRTDCDQDCIWISVSVVKDENSTCHTGRKTCFYRELEKNLKLKMI